MTNTRCTAVEGDIPVLDPEVLDDLRDKLDSPRIALKFADDYVGMWEMRRDRLSAALKRSDFPAAVDAVISLRVSSAMVGAVRLSCLAQRMENAVIGGDLAVARELIPAVAACGEQTVDRLRLIGIT